MASFEDFTKSSEWKELGLPAEEYYTYELPYHNWNHGLQVARMAFTIGQRCVERGLGVDLPRAAIGGAWHDAGYHEDHRGKGFATKERYSVAIASDYLKGRVDDELIAGIARDILGTTLSGEPRQDPNTYVLHRADMANMGDAYPVFARNNYALLLEIRQRQPNLTFAEWKILQAEFTQFVVAEARHELPVLGEPIQTETSFDTIALQNGLRFDQATTEAEFLGDIALRS